MDQNENYERNFTFLSVHKKQRIINSKLVMFLLEGHIRPVSYIVLFLFELTPNTFNLFISGFKNRFIRQVVSSRRNTPAAFYAYISSDFGRVGANHVFRYDTVVTNQGNVYNKHTGAFTAPSNGLYAFCYTAFASGVHVAGETGDYGEVTVKLIHNGDYKGSIHVDTESEWDDDMSTGFAILMLEAGDVVFTKSKDAGQGSFRSSDMGRWSFSGFQIA